MVEAMSGPNITYGTANSEMGMDNLEHGKSIILVLRKTEIQEIDCTPRYLPINLGRAEIMLTEVGAETQCFIRHTRVLTAARSVEGAGEHTSTKINESIEVSFQRLKSDRLGPDPSCISGLASSSRI